MARYINANGLYERTAEWEARALEKVEELNRIPPYEMTDEDWKEWRIWTAILDERTAFKCDVANAPTADVVERKKGKWIGGDGNLGRKFFKCSVCKDAEVVPTVLGVPQYRYCPNCGAEMEVDS